MKCIIIGIICLASCNSYDSSVNNTTLIKGLYPVAEFTGFVDDPGVCDEIAAFLNNQQRRGGHREEFMCFPSRILD